jgi:hypothetical protein
MLWLSWLLMDGRPMLMQVLSLYITCLAVIVNINVDVDVDVVYLLSNEANDLAINTASPPFSFLLFFSFLFIVLSSLVDSFGNSHVMACHEDVHTASLIASQDCGLDVSADSKIDMRNCSAA